MQRPKPSYPPTFIANDGSSIDSTGNNSGDSESRTPKKESHFIRHSSTESLSPDERYPKSSYYSDKQREQSYLSLASLSFASGGRHVPRLASYTIPNDSDADLRRQISSSPLAAALNNKFSSSPSAGGSSAGVAEYSNQMSNKKGGESFRNSTHSVWGVLFGFTFIFSLGCAFALYVKILYNLQNYIYRLSCANYDSIFDSLYARAQEYIPSKTDSMWLHPAVYGLSAVIVGLFLPMLDKVTSKQNSADRRENFANNTKVFGNHAGWSTVFRYIGCIIGFAWAASVRKKPKKYKK